MRGYSQGVSSPRFLESLLICFGLFSFLVFTSSTLGIWENWETLQANLVRQMVQDQTWLQVNLPVETGRLRQVAELAPGWWPAMLMSVLQSSFPEWISPELAMRIPSLFLMSLLLSGLYTLMITWRRSRIGALFALGIACLTPVVSVAARHTITSGGIGALSCALAMLCFILTFHVTRNVNTWYLIGLVSFVFSGISLGLIGILLPLFLFGYASRSPSELDQFEIRLYRFKLLLPLLLIGLIYWRCWEKRIDTASFSSLFVLIDPLSDKYDYADWKGFQTTLHLIGFGLFPIGAFLPALIFSMNDEPEHQRRFFGHPSIGQCLKVYLFLGLFGVALMAPYSGYWGGGSTLLLIPFAAGASYFWLDTRQGQSRPLVIWLGVLLLWFILDSDLKHQPNLMVSSISGADPVGLLSEVSSWRWIRRFSLIAFGIIIAWRTPFLSALNARTLSVLREGAPAKHHPILSLIGVIGALACLLPQTLSVIPRWVVANAFVNASFWGPVTFNARLTALTLIGGAGSYWLAHLGWRYLSNVQWSARQRLMMRVEVSGALSLLIITPHYLGKLPVWRFMKPALQWLNEGDTGGIFYFKVFVIHLLIITLLMLGLTGISLLFSSSRRNAETLQRGWFNLQADRGLNAIGSRLSRWRGKTEGIALFGWLSGALFFTHWIIPPALNAQLSHKPLFDRFHKHIEGERSLQLYQINSGRQGYYLRELEEMKSSEFAQWATSSERAFIILERERLSQVNREFRQASGRHLPLIDDAHPQLLLATNLVVEEAEDRNPIRRAVIQALPEGAQVLSEPINFEDKLELLAWRNTPSVPSSGGTMRLEMFWRVKKKLRSQWKVFVHIDAPGERIHGDHEPVAGVYSMKDWQEGDLIHDEHLIEIKAGLKSKSFTFFSGLYRGSTRMKIMNTDEKLKDKENRANLGRIRLK